MNSSPVVKKQINLKAVLILTVATVVFGLTVYFVHGFQVQRTASGLAEQADLFKQMGKGELAINSLEQYLGLMPEDDDSLAKFGSWLDEAAKNPVEKSRALAVLKQALRRVDQLEIQRKVARLSVELGRFAEASDQLTKLLEKQKQLNQDVEILKLRARAEAGTKNFEKAEEFYAQALEQAEIQKKTEAELYEQYAYLLSGPLKDREKGDEQIEKMVAEMAPTPKALLTAARYYRNFVVWDRAEYYINLVLKEKGTKEAEAFLLAGEVAQAKAALARTRGEKDEAAAEIKNAHQRLNEGLKNYPKNLEIILALARLELQEGNKAPAVQHLQIALKQLPDRIDQLFALGNLLLDADQPDQTKTVIGQFQKYQLTPFAEYLRARAAAFKQNWGEAALILERARSSSLLSLAASEHEKLGPRIELLLGDCYARLGNPDRQVLAYQRALEKAPGWRTAELVLAGTLTTTGRLKEAIKQYEQLADQGPEYQLELARLLIEQNRTLPLAKRQWGRVEGLLNKLSTHEKVGGQAAMLRANMLATQGKLDQAKSLAEAIRKQDPKQIGPWLLLVAIAQSQKDQEAQVLQYLDEAEKETGPKVEWHLTRAGYMTRKDPAKAKGFLQEMEKDLPKFSDADQERLLAGLGEMYHNLNAIPEAKNLWKQLAQRQPKNLGIRFRLLEMAYQAQELQEIKLWLGEIRELEGGAGAFTPFGEAAELVILSIAQKQNHLAKAHAKLDQAAALRPSWSRIVWLRGIVYDLENKKDKALDSYQKAIELGDRRLGIYKRSLELMRELGMVEQGNELLKELPNVVKNSEDFYRLSVEMTVLSSAQKDAHQQALEIAEKETAKSEDYKDFLWLGQVAGLAKSPAKAEQAYRMAVIITEKAHRKAVDAKEEKEIKQKEQEQNVTWVILLVYLSEIDEKKARAEIEVAKSKLNKGQLPIVLAPVYEVLKEPKEAETHYQTALAAAPNDPALVKNMANFYGRHAPAKAEPFLRKLLRPELKAGEGNQHWARRTLALVLSKHNGDYTKFTEALALLEQNRIKGQLSLADQQSRALVLAEHPGHRSEAIKELEPLVLGKDNAPESLRFRLAQLYFASQRWTDASSQVQQLLNVAKGNPVYLAFQVRTLLKKGDTFGASREVDKLAKVLPKAFTTVELQARVAHADNKTTQAKNLLMNYVRDEAKAPLHLVGQVLEDLKFIPEAEQIFKKFADTAKDPNDPLQFALFLGRQGRVDEALAICEKSWDKGSPAAVGMTCAEIITQGKADPAQQEMVVTQLKKAIKDHPKEQALTIILGHLYGYEGRTAEAIQIYRDTLAQNKNDLLTMNNLAYLLAFQDGKVEEARQMIETAIKLGGPLGELFDTRAVVWLRSKKPKEAIRDLEDTLRQTPSAMQYFHLAQAYLMDGDRSKAEQYFRQALEEPGFSIQILPHSERSAFTTLAKQFIR